MRVLVVGAGVIGSVYGAKLIAAGHSVTFVARGGRLRELQNRGLRVTDADTKERMGFLVTAVREIPADQSFGVVLVAVRAEQIGSAIQPLSAMTDNSDVLFFGNLAGHGAEIIAALGSRVMYGFPAAGGVFDDAEVRYVLINQQKTMLGEPDGTTSRRLLRLQSVLDGAGFSTQLSRDMSKWMSGHAAFVAPIAFALYRDGVDAARLSADPETLRMMVRATKQSFSGLRAGANREIPRNLDILYRMPTAFVTNYWRKVLAGPHGELWFAAHTRSAPGEMRQIATELQSTLRANHRPSAALDALLAD